MCCMHAGQPRLPGARAQDPIPPGRRLETFRGWVAAAPTEARRALLARCEALLGERDPDEAFGEAIRAAPALPPLQRARTGLLYREWLRRQRRRPATRAAPRAPGAKFRKLGAVPSARRAG